ncbi:hypothetical protein DV515_00008544, partial [Chloebia gouldiae]
MSIRSMRLWLSANALTARQLEGWKCSFMYSQQAFATSSTCRMQAAYRRGCTLSTVSVSCEEYANFTRSSMASPSKSLISISFCLASAISERNIARKMLEFHLTCEQARAIVATCPSCQQNALPSLSSGTNPRGLKSCEVWQMDVTHIQSFGKFKYVHVSVDTFSSAVYASAHTGEKNNQHNHSEVTKQQSGTLLCRYT